MKPKLKGRVALITGNANTVNAAIALTLAEEGAKVGLLYSNGRNVNRWREDLAAKKVKVAAVKADLASLAACEAAIQEIEAELGPVDIVVNNHGVAAEALFREMDKSHWDDAIGSSLDSVFNVTRPLIPGMLDRGWGRVINISSVYGQSGAPGRTSYAAAKAAVHGFTMALAQEVARKGITVNTVLPGPMDGNGSGRLSKEEKEAMTAMVPAGRLGTAEDLAYIVQFLASDQAAYVTGVDIEASGGQHLV